MFRGNCEGTIKITLNINNKILLVEIKTIKKEVPTYVSKTRIDTFLCDTAIYYSLCSFYVSKQQKNRI